jgi:hypothetical protein
MFSHHSFFRPGWVRGENLETERNTLWLVADVVVMRVVVVGAM